MQKIAIVGCSGAGKSTLARELGARLGLPVFHLDAYFWQAGWQALPRDEEARRLTALLDQTSWIIDGNYGTTIPVRFRSADTLIFLDFATGLCLWRVLKRWLMYRGRTRPDWHPVAPKSWTGLFCIG